MTEPLAIVLAGVGAAIVTGLVAVISSAVSLRSVKQQMESQAREQAEDRRHQIVLAVMQRRHLALEGIWQLLFDLERDGKLSVPETGSYVRNLMWLPMDIQKDSLDLLNDSRSRNAAKFAHLRQKLMDQATATEFR